MSIDVFALLLKASGGQVYNKQERKKDKYLEVTIIILNFATE